VLLPGVDGNAARSIAERLRKAVAEIRVPHGKASFGFTASMGIASISAEDRSFESALSRADTALYAAKDAGRNCVKVG
jgi:diguanylate cyclase (GGDEF)-like protein